MHILLVEDDSVIADAIGVFLGQESMQVTHAPDLSAAKVCLKQSQFDVCVLDLSLPDGNGLTLLKALRQRKSSLPVLVLTARDTVDDKIAGLDAGADDYLGKPFDFRELVARLQSLNRRAKARYDNQLHYCDFRFDFDCKCLFKGDTRIVLSATELRLMLAFLNNPSQVLSESHLKDVLYGAFDDVASNALNVHLFNLRKKLGANVIVTERGIGYRLATPGELLP